MPRQVRERSLLERAQPNDCAAVVEAGDNTTTMPTQKELMNQAKTDYGVGGSDNNFFRFDKTGEYRLRLLTPGYPMATHFFGKGVKGKVCYGADKGCPYHGEKAGKDEETGEERKASVKFVSYVLDRNDGQIKLAELPFSVIKVVTDLQEDTDYAFEDFPAPYDLKITFNKETNSPADKYKTLPSPKMEPLTEDQVVALAEKMSHMTPEQYIQKRKDKQRESDAADAVYEGVAQEKHDYPDEEINPEDIPF